MSLRRSDALTLRRERLDLDALAAHRPAPIARYISGHITIFAVGDADKAVSPGNGEPDAYGGRARIAAQRVEEVFLEGPGEVIAAEVRPGAVLLAERAGAIRAKERAAACDGRVPDEGWRLRHTGQHDQRDRHRPGAFQLLRLSLSHLLQHVENSALYTVLSVGCLSVRLSARDRRQHEQPGERASQKYSSCDHLYSPWFNGFISLGRGEPTPPHACSCEKRDETR